MNSSTGVHQQGDTLGPAPFYIIFGRPFVPVGGNCLAILAEGGPDDRLNGRRGVGRCGTQ